MILKQTHCAVLVIDSIGAHFCTGLDLKRSNSQFTDDGVQKIILKAGKLIKKLEECSLPVVTICRGSVRGGGMMFPCMSDIVLSEKNSSFGFPEIRLGGFPAAGNFLSPFI
jgi:3-hydroxyacyl-CoA dehydrogenase / enoyl-CoA hydratase / 3-hydroxybutyryl-CoA epimerase / enoyl-CoA isomerase